MKKISTLFFVLFLVATAQAQVKYWVFFADKPEAESQLRTPLKYLGEKALARRAVQNIELNASDMPVSAIYLREIEKGGAVILRTSKWLNAASVFATREQIEALKKLPFVRQVKPVQQLQRQAEEFQQLSTTQSAPYNYGPSFNQIAMLNGNVLHDAGSRGQGMLIAVLDGGFFGVNTYSAFDSLWSQNGIVFTKDYNDGDTNVFHRGSHGTSVLSVLAGNVDNQLIGSAPKADYLLLQSENETSETTIEEDNWVAAAEFADSAGAQIITSSLGYFEFDGGIGDYTYADLDGRTTVTTQAALMAARKGMLVVNSAGNEGTNPWGYIIPPADADSILAVGGVDAAEFRVAFSSYGPTADGRIKPDVCAKAHAVVVVNAFGTFSAANGTSFSAPLISGLSACLWQRHPNRTAWQVREAIIQSAHKYQNPDTLMGYGIPDFGLADFYLSVIGNEELPTPTEGVLLVPNPFQDVLLIKATDIALPANAQLTLISLKGEVMLERTLELNQAETEVANLPHLPAGSYIAILTIGNHAYYFRLVR